MSTTTNGVEVKWNQKHRPKANKSVPGTPNAPGYVTIIKETETQGFGSISSFTGWAGPADAMMDFRCWFKGKFDDVLAGGDE